MKIFELKIKDEDHQIAILMSEEEARQLSLLVGSMRHSEIKKQIGPKHYKELKVRTYSYRWHTRIFRGLTSILEDKKEYADGLSMPTLGRDTSKYEIV